jgi:hypothetical protein
MAYQRKRTHTLTFELHTRDSEVVKSVRFLLLSLGGQIQAPSGVLVTATTSDAAVGPTVLMERVLDDDE